MPAMTGGSSSEKDAPAWLRQVRLEGALFLVYALVLLALINSRPLWLDEVVQLEGTCGGNWSTLVQQMLKNAGGAPLGYIGQQWILSLTGCSIWGARVLSVVAGAASLALLVALSKQLRLARSTIFLVAAYWAVCPLAVRYSLEGRPYMQALLFALGSVAAQLQLWRTGKIRWAAALAACLAAAVYSQPFAIFAPLGFSAWSVWQSRSKSRDVVLTFAAYAMAGLSFLPWLMAAHSHWRHAIALSHRGFVWTPSVFLLLFRESMGDGYPAAVPIAVLAAVGAVAAARRPFHQPRLPVLGAVLAGILLGLLADAKFNYFFAIRQVIYIVPFVLLLAAEGATILWANRPYRVPVVIFLAIFAAAAITKDYRYLTDRREDWNRFSAHLSDSVQSGCILLPVGDEALVEDEVALYTVFRPEIAHRLCDAGLLPSRIVVPSHPYTEPRALRAEEDVLSAKGMRRLSIEQVGFAKIEVYTKPDAPGNPIR